MSHLTRFLILALTVLVLPLDAASILRNPLPIPLGTNDVQVMLKGDFNGDGHEDVLLVNTEKALVVLLDNGTGPFAAPVVTPGPYRLTGDSVGDFNGDGKLDVVVWASGSIIVMLGNGDGSFTPGPSFTPSFAGPLAVGDFNGDHNLDIAIASADSHSLENVVAVYLGDGKGHFSAGVTTTLGNAAGMGTLTAADVNADGRSDLIATDSFGTTHILIAAADGTFAEKSAFGANGAVAAGDFNHDGRMDLAFSDGIVYFGNGDGTFTRGETCVVGYASASIVAADVDGDGNLDLLAAGPEGDNVTVLRGKGDGTFFPPQIFLVGPGGLLIVVSDFDRDGKLDILAAGNTGELPAVSFVRGNGDGTFAAYRGFHTTSLAPIPWPGLSPSGCVVADMNQDGRPDAVIMQKDPLLRTWEIGVMLNDGTGKLGGPFLTNTGLTGNVAFKVGDVNHDGKLDVVVLAALPDDTLAGRTYLGSGDGTFGPPVSFTPSVFTFNPILADFDGDGIPDLLVQPELQHGNGDGTFGAGVGVALELPALTGDINGDGKLDFVASGAGNPTAAYINDGTGHFTRKVVTTDSNTPVALADFNGDGKLDILFRTYTGIQVRLGNGDGTFGAPIEMTLTPAPDPAVPPPFVAADFDGDGKMDVAFGTTILLGNGDGTFRSRVRYRTFGGASFVNAVDMDGNGSPDLVYMPPGADDVDVVLTRTWPDPTELSSIVMSADKTTIEYRQSVTFTARVTGGGAPPSGAVAFAEHGHTLALVAVDGTGTASFTTTLPVGSHAISATFDGDENYLSSTATTSIEFIRARTELSIEGGPNPAGVGPVDVSVNISYGATGNITLRDGNSTIGRVTGSGDILITGLTIGTHVITADYPGDANFQPATASYVQVITNPVPYLAVSVTPSGNVAAGALVTLHAYFRIPTHVANFTGTVSYYEKDVLIGSSTLVNGTADFRTSFKAGQHSIQARYSGDSNWGPDEYSFFVYAIPQPRHRAAGH